MLFCKKRVDVGPTSVLTLLTLVHPNTSVFAQPAVDLTPQGAARTTKQIRYSNMSVTQNGTTTTKLTTTPTTITALPTPGNTTAPVAYSPEHLKAVTTRMNALGQQERLCARLINIKVQNATLEEVITAVKAALPQAERERATIEVRRAPQAASADASARFSFALNKAPMGNILENAASLSGYHLYLLPGLLLITSDQLLKATETSDASVWTRSRTFSGSGWSYAQQTDDYIRDQILAQLRGVAATQTAAGAPATLRFAELTPELQGMVQDHCDNKIIRSGDAPIPIPPDARFTLISDEPGNTQFVFQLGANANNSQGVSRGFGWFIGPTINPNNTHK